jgi:hypothetical protein
MGHLHGLQSSDYTIGRRTRLNKKPVTFCEASKGTLSGLIPYASGYLLLNYEGDSSGEASVKDGITPFGV